tara:strand:+ start:1207 stop:1416 length:210 start_codon:yes stop_codon:yes gene_type:complete
MQWKVRIMEKPDLMANVRVMFLEAPSFEEAKKQVLLNDNNVATFETLEEDYVKGTKTNMSTVPELLSKE